MIVYKVVRRYKKGHRVSAFVGDDTHLLMRYPKGKKVKPRIGKAFAFSTLKAAMEWYWGNEIWEAETTSSEPAPDRIIGNVAQIRQYLERYWAGASQVELYFCNDTPAPLGSVLCPNIKLLKLVAAKNAHEEWRNYNA